MKAVWVNPDQPQKSVGREAITCEVCGKIGFPYPPWRYYEFGVGWLLNAYDYQFYVCSPSCDVKSVSVRLDKQRELNIKFSEKNSSTMPKFIKDLLWPKE